MILYNITMKIKFKRLYHGTSKKNWLQIKQDGFMKGPVYLTPKPEVAYFWGETILEINTDSLVVYIDPYEDESYEKDTTGKKNLFMVKENIPLSAIRRIN